MRKRPLCVVCLVFLLVQAVRLMITSGDDLAEVPASSIFYEMQVGEERQVRVQGQIYKKEYTSNNQVLYLKNNSISDQSHFYEESRMMIYDENFCELAIGETILVSGSIQKFEGARNPENFDRQLYYARKRIYGCVFDAQILVADGKEHVLSEHLFRLRNDWKEMLCKHMSREQGPVLSAMILNEKTDMEEEMRELYQKNGMSHALAISGLHISFIGLGLYQLLRKLRCGYVAAGSVSVLVLIGYVLMIGFSVSILRALVMLLLRLGADMTGRVYDLLTALLFSAAITAAYQPLYLTDAAFCLSYGAVFAIFLVLPIVQKLLPQNVTKYKVGQLMIGGGVSSMAIQLFLFPMILYFYFEMPLTSFLLNVAVIPLMSWVLGLGIYGSAWCLIWEPLGSLLLKLCDWILMGISWMGERGLEFSFLRLVFGKPDIWKVLLYYLLFFVSLWWLKRKKKICVFLVVALCVFVPIPKGTLQITMLDVGQGDCIFVKGPKGNHYLIDGGSSDVEQVGKYRMEPFLKSQGVEKLDYVFVSHGDVDHCNGIQELIERKRVGIQIETLVLPVNYKQSEELLALVEVAFDYGVEVVMMDVTEKIVEGELEISCLQPQDVMSLNDNAGSMVLKFTFGEFNMLFTGDVEGEGEAQLFSQSSLTACDVLKVAHHGSKNSTTEEILRKIHPNIALISAGRKNSYGHPHEETLERLRDIGSQIYRTDTYGAIILETDGEFIDIFPSSI